MTILLSFLVPLFLDAGQLKPIFLTTYNLGLILVGYYLLDSQLGTSTWGQVTLALAVFLFAYYLVDMSRNRVTSVRSVDDGDYVRIWAFTWIIAALAIYHFVAGGIPVLSNDVEIDRFGFSNSGLFGLPGRMYLYGLPFLVMYTATSAEDPKQHRLHKVAWVLYVVSRVLSGFKGAMVEVVSFYVIVKALSGQPINMKQLFRGRAVVAIVSAVGWVFFMLFQYNSFRFGDLNQGADYLLQRMTVTAAAPGHLVLTQLALRPPHVPFLVADTMYFLQKYFGWAPISGHFYPLEQIVSSLLYGVPLNGDYFLAPVTIGSFAQFSADFGFAFGVCAMGVMGAFYAMAAIKARRSATRFGKAAWSLTVWVTHVFLLNGGLAYILINTAAVLVFLFLLQLAIRLVLPRARRGPYQAYPVKVAL